MNEDIASISKDLDVVIIGGGIVGCTAFRELCMSGLNTLLIEKDDFCCDISSGSTEMAHGGFRYLLTISDWPLVIESLVEREILHVSAPHLVRRLNFYMPLYGGDQMYFNPSIGPLNLGDIKWKIGKYYGYGTSMVGAGMMLYKLFAEYGIKHNGLPTNPADVGYEKLSMEKLVSLGFGLETRGLAGGFRYTDSKIEDVERLGLENVLSGLEYAKENNLACGACNRTELVKVGRDGELIVRTLDDGEEFTLKPRVIVNAAGATINNVNGMVDPSADADIHLVAGSHLLAPRTNWDNDDPHAAVAWWTNKKIMFSISKGTDRLLIGTHERYISREDVEKRNLNHREDLAEIVRNAGKVFPKLEYDPDSHPYYTRVRPLKPDEKHLAVGAEATRFSRRDYVRVLGNMVSVTGKLGPSRCLAEMAMKKVFEVLGRNCPKSGTAARKLYGGDMGAPVEEYVKKAMEANPAMDGRTVKNAVFRYGSRYGEMLAGAEGEGLSPIDPDCPDSQPMEALVYSFRVEGARSLVHAFRKTGTYRHLGEGLNCVEAAAAYTGSRLGWDEAGIQREIDNYRKFIRESRTVI